MSKKEENTFKKLIKIFEYFNKDIKLRIVLLLIGLISASLLEIFFLNSLSIFIGSLISDNNSVINGLDQGSFLTNAYLKIINIFSFLSTDKRIVNCYAYIFIILITFLARLLSLRIIIFESAYLGTYLESKCADIVLSLNYEESKKLNSSEIMTEFNLVGTFVSAILQNGLQMIASLTTLLFISSYLILFSSYSFLLALLLIVFIYVWISKFNSKKLSEISKNSGFFHKKRTSAINYMILMFRQLLLNSSQKETTNSVRAAVEPLYRYSAKGSYLALYPKILIEYLAIIIIVISLFFQIVNTSLTETIENTGVILFALLRITPSMQIIYLFFTSIRKEKYTINCVYDLLTLKTKRKKKTNNDFNKINFNSDKNKLIKTIELEEINFKYYRNNFNTISNFSYTFERGNSYALVGGSGSGKSTLLDLILYLLDFQNGDIYINSESSNKNKINYMRNKFLIRKNVLLIGQNDFNCGSYVNDFLEINKTFFEKTELKEKLKKGINALGLNKILNRNILETFIGENGCKLSGGQLQRLFLLKAYLSNKQIIIFDEATSALDYDNEQKAINLIFSKEVLSKERIIIFSTHSEAIKNACDYVVEI